MSEKLETISRKQFWRLPEFAELPRSTMYYRYREFLALSGHPDPSRYTRLKIVDLAHLTNMTEEHIRRSLQ